MRLAAAAVALLLLTGAASAQFNMIGAGEKPVDPEAEEKQRKIDEAYKAKIQSQKGSAPAPVNDPWGAVRSSEKAVPAKPQPGPKNRELNR